MPRADERHREAGRSRDRSRRETESGRSRGRSRPVRLINLLPQKELIARQTDKYWYWNCGNKLDIR